MQPGGAADTREGGLAGEHQLRGVCQDGARPIEVYGGEGGGGREGEQPLPGLRPFSSLSFKFLIFLCKLTLYLNLLSRILF